MIKTLISLMLVLALCQAGKRRTLEIATDSTLAPSSFLENGELVGFDIDLLAAVAKEGRLNYELEQTSWNELFEQVSAKSVDLAVAAITINEEREESYDFSVPYFLSTHKILASEGTNIETAADLAGQVVAVREGTTGEAAVIRVLGGDSDNIRRFADAASAIEALTNGEVDAYVDDSAPLEYHANNNEGFVVVEDSDSFEDEFYGLLFPQGSKLRARFNKAITAVLKNGEYERIFTEWFGTTADVDALLEAGKEGKRKH
jgi:glutamine transport system substrate-binding protein